MDHVNHVPLNHADLISGVLEGATIYGADDHQVGTLDHIHGTSPSGKAVIKSAVSQGKCLSIAIEGSIEDILKARPRCRAFCISIREPSHVV